MTDAIPNIAFYKKTPFEFEALPLNHLLSRKDQLEHPLDQPQRLGFHQIIFLTKGTGQHYIDFKAHHVTTGDLVFVSKGQVQVFDVTSETDGFLLLFTEAFITNTMIHSDMQTVSRLYNYHLYPPVITPPKASFAMFSGLLSEIYNEYLCKDAFAKEEVLRTLLKLFLLRAERIQRTLTTDEKNSEWIATFSDFRKLLSSHFPETRNASDYAGMMAVSYHHLNRIVKAITGTSVKAFIDDFIILEIKRRMAVSDASVKELTYEMGFDEPTNFVKYFKKHTQQSPVQFRKSLMT